MTHDRTDARTGTSAAQPSPAPSSFWARVRAKIDALKQRGPQPDTLGSGMAARAARDVTTRSRRIDQAVDEATR